MHEETRKHPITFDDASPKLTPKWKRRFSWQQKTEIDLSCQILYPSVFSKPDHYPGNFSNFIQTGTGINCKR